MINREQMVWAAAQAPKMLDMVNALISQMETLLSLPDFPENKRKSLEKNLKQARERRTFYENDIEAWKNVRALLDGLN